MVCGIWVMMVWISLIDFCDPVVVVFLGLLCIVATIDHELAYVIIITQLHL